MSDSGDGMRAHMRAALMERASSDPLARLRAAVAPALDPNASTVVFWATCPLCGQDGCAADRRVCACGRAAWVEGRWFVLWEGTAS